MMIMNIITFVQGYYIISMPYTRIAYKCVILLMKNSYLVTVKGYKYSSIHECTSFWFRVYVLVRVKVIRIIFTIFSTQVATR